MGFDDRELLERMCDSLLHRGPDDRGVYTDSRVGLGNTRLSVIDLRGGHQPIHNEDETVFITHNGEIYNYRALRSELEVKGHRFYTSSDTEVLVHSYEEYGDTFVNMLSGIFAFGLWDARAERLLLARDRVGVKPLYYTMTQGGLLFASEIKAMLQAQMARRVSVEGLHLLLNLGYIPGPITLFEGISKVSPGHTLVYEDGSVAATKFWDLPTMRYDWDKASLVEQLKATLQSAITSQLVADVPVGSFLSGGLDTSTIVAYASKASPEPLQTFCMGFGEETDELDDARMVAEYFGTDHHNFVIDSGQGMRLYPKMIWHMDMPKINLYSWFVCEVVRKYVKVCLSGLGGDELFGGYPARYGNALRIERMMKLPFKPAIGLTGRLAGKIFSALGASPRTMNRLRVLQSLGDRTGAHLILSMVLPREDLKRLYRTMGHDDRSIRHYYEPYFSSDHDFLQQLINAELKTKLPDDFLAVDDGMSMAHSLEVRVPLLDNLLLDLMIPVPWKYKYAPGTYGKLILREAVKDILPDRCLGKPKWGFSVNIFAWYKGEMGEYAKQILPESDVIEKYFNQRFITEILSRPLNAKHTRYYNLIWHLLGFHIWHRIYIEGHDLRNPELNIEKLG